ncbi:substrate-binding domain-containing protein [Paenibacillus hexagrammi]|uniref:Substrate-binding domain-containing protein n=2 Tax=Paenibacillus hexagrammi TaxID=2908839 RepID=A0ABY3STB7_9BACL|nr:substrate-binding domain-containing protein [Paenibacillus sp. YPD9-1]
MQADAGLAGASSPPDAVVCMNNYTAFGALKAIHARGVQVPQQVGLATFDQYPLAPYTSPPLTSLNIDTFELGVAAATMLMQRIHGMEHKCENRLMLPQLTIRESTRRKR